jgi:hypothetical protein
MYWRIGKTTVKTLLMEVLSLSTPTSSGNYKVFLETLQDERGIDIACRAPLAPLCQQAGALVSLGELGI